MAAHEPQSDPEPLLGAAGPADKENAGSPPAPKDDGRRKRQPCEELVAVEAATEAEYSAGPPSKRLRQSAGAAPWHSPEEPAVAAPGADSCQQPGSSQEPGCNAVLQTDPAAPQADPAAIEQQAPAPALHPHDQQAAGLPDWCDKAPTLWLPEDGQVDAFCYLPGHPMLALACEGQAALLAKVLHMAADPDAKDSRGFTALHMACRHARLACTRCLLDAGADTRVREPSGKTAADLAAAEGHDDVLDMLRQHEEVQAALAAQEQDQARCETGGCALVR
ncbi:hypothetical protein ABPG75_013322 [Micractinium tetrahymenae]